MSSEVRTDGMTTPELQVQEVRTKQDLMAFVRFPWTLYREDRYWVPPLIKEVLSKFDPSHPFLSHAEMTLFLATREGQIVGRIAGIIDRSYIEYHHEKTGFFGFFESVNDQVVAAALFAKVRNWLEDRNMERMAGPMNPSTSDECALLIDGFDSSPRLMMPYNPPYYISLFEGMGLKKVMDLYAYFVHSSTVDCDRLARIAGRMTRKDPIHVRPLDPRRFHQDLKIVKAIYNDAWSRNWGFVPLTEAEIDFLAKTLKPLVVPELVLFAYLGNEPVGFLVGLPDYNSVLKRLNGKVGLVGALKFLYYSKKIDTLRVMLLGVKKDFQKRGIEGLLYLESFKNGVKRGYFQAECSWVLESNPLMQRGLEALGGKREKTYRIYDMPL